MKMLKQCLFVGGPWDGRRIDVDVGLSRVLVDIPYPNLKPGMVVAALELTRIIYRREILRARGKEIFIYVHEKIQEGDTLAALVSGYRSEQTT